MRRFEWLRKERTASVALPVIGIGIDGLLCSDSGETRLAPQNKASQWRGRDLQRESRQRLLSGVSHGESGVNFEIRLCGREMNVEIIGGEGQRGTLRVGDRLDGVFGGSLRRLPVRENLIPAEENLAVRRSFVGGLGGRCLSSAIGLRTRTIARREERRLINRIAKLFKIPIPYALLRLSCGGGAAA